MRIPLDITEMKEQLEYYEDESYYDEEYDTNHLDTYPDATDSDRNPTEATSERADLYHKYDVERSEEESVNHVLLEATEQGEGSGQEENKNRKSDLDKEKAVEEVVEEVMEAMEEVVFSKSEQTEKSSYSSLRHDTVSMTEDPREKKIINEKENKTVPLKALRVMNASTTNQYSIISLILPIFLSQI